MTEPINVDHVTALVRARSDLLDAETRLDKALNELCPRHEPKQYRDGKKPWCRFCGRDARGGQIR